MLWKAGTWGTLHQAHTVEPQASAHPHVSTQEMPLLSLLISRAIQHFQQPPSRRAAAKGNSPCSQILSFSLGSVTCRRQPAKSHPPASPCPEDAVGLPNRRDALASSGDGGRMERVHLPLEKCPHKDKLQDPCCNRSADWERSQP